MSEKKHILLLGANRYNVRAISAARRAGFYVLAADGNPNAPGLSAADEGLHVDIASGPALVEVIQSLPVPIDGIVSMAEVGIRSAAYAAGVLGLPGNSEEAAGFGSSKANMRRLWGAACGEYSVNFEVVKTLEEAYAAAQRICFPFIMKPDRSFGGSRGVRRVETLEEIKDAFEFARAGGLQGSDIVVETCLQGDEFSTEVLIWGGRTSVLCIGKKVKSPYPYRVDVSVQYPAPLTEAEESRIADMCDKAINAIGLRQGVAHIEFAIVGHCPKMLEINCRCGGGHTPQIAHHVSGVNEFIEFCRMSCGLDPEKFVPSARRGAEYRFLVFSPGKYIRSDIPKEVREHPNVADIDVTLASGEIVRPIKTTSDRAGFVVVLAEESKKAQQIADWATGRIHVVYDGEEIRYPLGLSEILHWSKFEG